MALRLIFSIFLGALCCLQNNVVLATKSKSLFESGCETFLHNQRFTTFCIVSDGTLSDSDYEYITAGLAEITGFEQTPPQLIFRIIKQPTSRGMRYTIFLMRSDGSVFAFGIGFTIPLAMDRLYSSAKQAHTPKTPQ